MRRKGLLAALAMLLLVTLTVPFTTLPVALAAPNDPAIVIVTPYTSLIAGRGKEVSFPLTVMNRGTSDEFVELKISESPKDWPTFLKDKDKGLIIRGVMLTAGMTQTVTFQAKPPATADPGEYNFRLQAMAKSGSSYTLDLKVGIEQQAAAGVRLVTYYPLLKGPSTSSFDFNVDLVNDSDDERVVGLVMNGPPDWRLSLRPSGESKEISNLRLKGGESKGLVMTINPASKAAAGQYTVEMQATSGEYKDALKLQMELLGNYELSMATDTGMLNTTATAGGAASITLRLTNKGSAELKDVSITSSKPQGWETVINPDKLDSIAPGATRDVPVTIKPAAKALAGDYQLTFTSTSGSASSNVQIRTTVETPTTWGWIGLGVVVLVVLVLIGIFVRIGRR
jgi:uncharacterized membrane protein